MKRLAWEQAVNHAVSNRPYLLPIYHDPLSISDHLRDYNPDLFAVLNVGRVLAKALGLPREQWPPLPHGVIPVWGAWWEIHSLTERPSLVLTVRHGALDKRVLHDLYASDLRIHGDRLFQAMDSHNDSLEEQSRREAARQLEAIAGDTRGLFARAAWGQSVFGLGRNASTGTVLPGVKN